MKALTTLTGLLLALLTSCKAEITNEQKEDAAFTRGIVLRVHCSKMVLIRLNQAETKLEHTETVPEGTTSQNANLGPKEFVGEFIYRLSEYADGSREINCQISDGKRQFYNSTSVSSKTAYMSDNLCSVLYDLDDPTNGSFSFWWQPNTRGLTYHDDYGFTKELFVRSSECSEL